MRIHGLSCQPDRIAFWPEPHGRFLLLVIPRHVFRVTPGLPVLSHRRADSVIHRAGARHVVVFPNEIGERNRQLAALDVIHAEAIPRCGTIAAAFILLAKYVHAKRRFTELLDATDRAALERRA